MLPLEDLLGEGRDFLAARYRRRASMTRGDFVWGRGSDHVALFEVPAEEARLAELAAARRHRADLFDAGLGWISGPPEYGGRGLPRTYEQAFARLQREFQVPSEGVFTIGLGMVAPTLLAHGSEAAKRGYLPALWRGDLIGCQLFSEPGAGSDLASVTTAAVADGEAWRITGQKVWTSEAHLSDVGLVLAHTSPGPRYQNLTTLLVDMHAPGVEIRPLRQMTGSAAFNEVFLDGVLVPDADRLGDVGKGWETARTTLRSERGALGGTGLGGRGIFSIDRIRALVEHLGVASDRVCHQHLARIVIDQRVSRYTRQRFESDRATGHPPGAEGSILKLQLCANFTTLADFVAEVLGPRITADTGEWGTYAWAQLLLGAPGYRIGGGTDEIQKNILAERVLGLPPE